MYKKTITIIKNTNRRINKRINYFRFVKYYTTFSLSVWINVFIPGKGDRTLTLATRDLFLLLLLPHIFLILVLSLLFLSTFSSHPPALSGYLLIKLSTATLFFSSSFQNISKKTKKNTKNSDA